MALSSMPELAGKTCPFCKAPFAEGEAVVFCSHCEMPHHLECWKENGGCTTFGCTGNIGKIIGAEQKNAQSAPVSVNSSARSAVPKAISHPQVRTAKENPHKINIDYFFEIQKWVKTHGKKYIEDNSFHTWTNVIAVNVGQTIDLDLYYRGNQVIRLSKTNGNCSTEWSKKWAENTTKLVITGNKFGLSELIFRLGDLEKANEEESFRVLVIVT